MLFHSYEFILVFLPLTFLGFVAVRHFCGRSAALLWLAAASIGFYGQWSTTHAALLLGSVLGNFAAARALVHLRESAGPARALLLAAVTANLAVLGYTKYMNFFIDNLNAAAGTDFSHLTLLLPVGISFYTFIQIAFLVEVYNRQIERVRFADYAVFASFLPCVTAGPIILQKEMMPQLADPPRALDATRIAAALTVFAIGLFKKLMLADGIAPYADAVFDGVAGGAAVAPGTAWIGALAYTLQLYFDFSGYSDMALGIGLLFGLRLPLNFHSPLKATSIVEFWRRWHMTMTRFFTSYLYTPLSFTVMRRAFRGGWPPHARFAGAVVGPIVVTFVLAGLWHGAGWTFVVFGLIHGAALAINHIWREAEFEPLPPAAGWLLTMLVVVVGLVFFRADSVPVAVALLGSMLGVGSVAGAEAVAVEGIRAVWLIVLLGLAVLTLPNTQQLLRSHPITCDPMPQPDPDAAPRRPGRLAWRATPAWAVAIALCLAGSLGMIGADTAFLYYKF